MYIRARLHDITYDDAINFAKDNGIRRPDVIIQTVADSLKQFHNIAHKYNVQDRWINSIEATINGHLTSWGLTTKATHFSFEIL